MTWVWRHWTHTYSYNTWSSKGEPHWAHGLFWLSMGGPWYDKVRRNQWRRRDVTEICINYATCSSMGNPHWPILQNGDPSYHKISDVVVTSRQPSLNFHNNFPRKYQQNVLNKNNTNFVLIKMSFTQRNSARYATFSLEPVLTLLPKHPNRIRHVVLTHVNDTAIWQVNKSTK